MFDSDHKKVDSAIPTTKNKQQVITKRNNEISCKGHQKKLKSIFSKIFTL